MTIPVQCPWCRHQFSVPGPAAGRKVVCPACEGKIRVRIPTPARLKDVDGEMAASSPTGETVFLPSRPAKTEGADPGHSIASIATGVSTHTEFSTGKRGTRKLGVVVAALIALLSVSVLLVISAGLMFFRSRTSTQPVITDIQLESPTIATESMAVFPEPAKQKRVRNRDITVYSVDLASDTRNSYHMPGGSMEFRIFSPDRNGAEDHLPQSLTCVLIPAGGIDILHGYKLEPVEQIDQVFPYVSAGMMVVYFSIDGALPQIDYSNKTYYWDDLQKNFTAFADAQGGIKNAKLAFDLVLQKLPAVHPGRIYIAGHYSAASLALRFAAVEPRLAGCLAYTPCVDFSKEIERMQIPAARKDFKKKVLKWAEEHSPFQIIQGIRCPAYLFQTKQDREFPFQDTESFVARLKETNGNVIFSLQNAQAQDPAFDFVEIMNGVNWIREDLTPVVLPKIIETNASSTGPAR